MSDEVFFIFRYGAAEKDCTDAIILDPSYVKAYMRRGTARKKLARLEPALDDFKQVVKLESENKPAQREVAMLEQVCHAKLDLHY